MAQKPQMQAPSGMAGLVRYYEEDKSIVKLKPEHVLGIAGLLIVVELFVFFSFPI